MEFKKKQHHIAKLRDKMHKELLELHGGVQAAPTLAGKAMCVAALSDIALESTKIIEALYASDLYRDLVKKLALSGDTFVGRYDFNLPSPLKSKPLAFESRGDEMRRDLTSEWEKIGILKSKGIKKFDFLRRTIQGFVKAVRKPPPLAAELPPDESSAGLDWFLECAGQIPVKEDDRSELLSDKDPTVWARVFVDWYAFRHPWPFLDGDGEFIWPEKRDEIVNPIHQIAFDRLMTLQKSNPDEKSPWNALRAVVRERFKSAF
ncbi:hypothetical protein N9023_07100 [Opitutaceae bacterium]|nr:hypothetical protein [Opitutaceae bacterium]